MIWSNIIKQGGNVDEFKEFMILRYSLVEEQQSAVFVEPLPLPKGEAILVAIKEDREFQLNGVKYSFVGFSEVIPPNGNSFPPARFYMGKTAKLKKTHMGTKVPRDIIETKEDDWIPIITIFDTETQHIFVRKDWRFGNAEHTMRAIQNGLRPPILAEYNHRIFVEGKTKVEHFWKVVDEHHKLFRLKLNLISPNILETNLRAREALAALKLLFGQDEVSIKLENESGELRVPVNPVGDYLEYIEEGEGSWEVTTEGKYGGKKRHLSSENTETIDLPVNDAEESEDSFQLRLDSRNRVVPKHGLEAKMIQIIYAEVNKSSDR
jgi:hypothetical protein